MTQDTVAMNSYLDPIRAHLKRYTQQELKAVAEEVGVSFHTLQKLRTGAIGNPTLATYDALKRHMEASEGDAA